MHQLYLDNDEGGVNSVTLLETFLEEERHLRIPLHTEKLDNAAVGLSLTSLKTSGDRNDSKKMSFYFILGFFSWRSEEGKWGQGC